MKQWEKVAQDCKRALEIDSSCVKAHFFYGQALLEIGLHDESIGSLRRGESEVLGVNGLNKIYFNRLFDIKTSFQLLTCL